MDQHAYASRAPSGNAAGKRRVVEGERESRQVDDAEGREREGVLEARPRSPACR